MDSLNVMKLWNMSELTLFHLFARKPNYLPINTTLRKQHIYYANHQNPYLIQLLMQNTKNISMSCFLALHITNWNYTKATIRAQTNMIRMKNGLLITGKPQSN